MIKKQNNGNIMDDFSVDGKWILGKILKKIGWLWIIIGICIIGTIDMLYRI